MLISCLGASLLLSLSYDFNSNSNSKSNSNCDSYSSSVLVVQLKRDQAAATNLSNTQNVCVLQEALRQAGR